VNTSKRRPVQEIAMRFVSVAVAWWVFLVLPPVTAWVLFVLLFPFYGFTFWLRFRSGKWKGRNVIPEEDVIPEGDLEPTPATQTE